MNKNNQSEQAQEHQYTDTTLPHCVIIGAGFGGLQVALALGKAPIRVTVVDRTNHHLFQPLLYQVSTGTLSPGEISSPIRHILRKHKNTDVIMAEVTGVDTQQQLVWMDEKSLHYDYLVVAAGSHENYFGHDEWRANSLSLKTIEDARNIRQRVFEAFEKAEIEPDEQRARELLTFVIVGAGPTGVELAGDIADLTHKVLPQEFRRVDLHMTRIILVEAMPRILPAFSEKLARKAHDKLRAMGVEVKTQQGVTEINNEGVKAGDEFIRTQTILWTAGVQATKVASWLGEPVDRSGRVTVGPQLNLPDHPNVFVIGDNAAYMQGGRPLPAVAPVAQQEGKYVARIIKQQVAAPSQQPTIPAFYYHDKGSMCAIGPDFGIIRTGRIEMAGFFAWIAWLAIHILNLISFENRVIVMLQWGWAYVSSQRRVRLITSSKARLKVPKVPLRV
jgi:NADH dehydrogenase, FAD-containing subunit